MSDHLAAIERRGDELELFASAERQARKWIAEHGTDSTVADIRECRQEHRRIRIGTASALVLLEHIDRLEALVSLSPRDIRP